MRDFLSIGPVPPDEECAQIGSVGYRTLAIQEAKAYINQLRRHFGPEPEGARLAAKTFEHDFGTYVEVVCKFDSHEGYEYALKCEAEGPMNWDQEALIELGRDDLLNGILPGLQL